jgi:serine/threonine protein kinase
MDAELQLIAQLLENAQQPEEVFGKLDGNQGEALRASYRLLSKVAHPDRYADPHDQAVAEKAFVALQKWLTSAEEKIKSSTYGQDGATHVTSAPPVLVRNRKREYLVQGTPFAQGDLCNLYRCTCVLDGRESDAIFKVARNPADNDLVSNEGHVLKQLASGKEYDRFHAYLPRLVDSFDYRDSTSPHARRVNVLALEEGNYYSLQEVRAAYPEGIDAKDMAWIWRRLLIVLGFAHKCNIIHGAVLPTHILIQPENHGLVLIDWSYALYEPSPDEYIPAISTEYKDWYPPEVLAKEPPRPGTDIYLGALCMLYLLGGDPVKGSMPESVHKRIQSFFRGTTLRGPAQRPQDALRLLDEFTELIESLWGPRTFREFYMPKK